jgi:hypothetical protein
MNLPAKFPEGQKVRIRSLIGTDGRRDPQLQHYVNNTGTVVKSYCVTRDEMPDLSKMFVYPDVYCYDVRLDADGIVVHGVPEVALEPHVYQRK